ncbi:MAG: hypothetical protein MUE73_17160 [Planctomycetes bacterium]|nr:hypothetical protein [Planctomycetota bacterium]
MIRTTTVAVALLALTGSALAGPAPDGIGWKHDVRAAFEEAEGRGVPLFIYLTRDD